MRVTSIKLANFASYKKLEFSFTEKGLVLIHGATGSGKSTLCDAIPWCLFGVTAKGGKVDEVLSWPGNEQASGVITLELNGRIFQVIRSRNPNDLVIWEDGGVYRGKDATDTQKLINKSLGMDYELFLSGSYFHEFSQTAQFFTTTAKNRRAMCEQLVDLSLPKRIQDNVRIKDKELQNELNSIRRELHAAANKLSTITRMQQTALSEYSNWEKSNNYRIRTLEKSASDFEEQRQARIKRLMARAFEEIKNPTCSECGAPKKANHMHRDYSKEVEEIRVEENSYSNILAAAREVVNPHSKTVKDFSAEIKSAKESIEWLEKEEAARVAHEIDLERLQEVTADFRGLLIKNTILDIESKTNVLLSSHFDAEIKVELAIEDDQLDINLIKDGNQCSFTQLSKGQRQMLKLCFGVAVMTAVANHLGIDFSQVFLDECADGMDENTKLKAMKLLEELSLKHDSVFVVEHSETFKAMVLNKIKVELVNGHSELCLN